MPKISAGLVPAIAATVALLSLPACAPEQGGEAAQPAPAAAAVVEAASRTPRSVILLVGDGMGPQQLALLMDWADAAGTAPTAFERIVDAGHLGLVRTGAEGSPLTDSASSATALACGVEVPNGFIAMDSGGRELPTCLEDAHASGRLTGLVTSTRLTHATPASFAAHVPTRGDEKTIAAQMLGSGAVDVMMGGGGAFVDLTTAPERYRKVGTAEQLAALAADGGPVLGVFAHSHLPYAIDRDAPTEASAPTLADMTTKALEILATGSDGFFLMVEGGRIDHAGHLNDVGAVLGEMREFDETIEVAERFRAAHPDTLVIVTADHETGGLAISGGGKPLLGKHFLAMAEQEASIEALAAQVPAEAKKGVDPEVFGVGRKFFYPPYSWWETSRALETSATHGVSYATQGHTTTPVVVVAAGPGSAEFTGLMQNERIGVLLREWMAPEENR